MNHGTNDKLQEMQSVLISVFHMHATDVAKHPRCVTHACSAYKSEYLYKRHRIDNSLLRILFCLLCVHSGDPGLAEFDNSVARIHPSQCGSVLDQSDLSVPLQSVG